MPGAEHDVSGNPIASSRDAQPGHRPDEARGGDSPSPSGLEDDLADLVDAAERLAGNPVVAWRAIQAELGRRIAHHQEWGLSGTGGAAGEEVEHHRPAQSTGGAMSTHPGVPTVARRPYTGFDLEVATYTRLKPELLSRFPGKFIVIVGDEVEGPFETFREALRVGYRRFGLGPLYVKQILAVEPIVEVTRDVVPCRS